EASWEDLEWSNQPRFAVSSTASYSGARRHLYLVDLRDSAYTRLATGVDVVEPGLWLGAAPKGVPDPSLDLDSLGHYNEPESNLSERVFSDKIAKFWSLHRDLELVSV